MIWLVVGLVLGTILLGRLHDAFVGLERSLAVIDTALADVVSECQSIVPALDGVPALAETEALTAAVPGLVASYVGELKPLL